MNWSLYTRGLGIGIVVTALLLIYAKPEGVAAISDDDIKNRARMLGMTESIVLSEYEPQSDPQDAEHPAEPNPVDVAPVPDKDPAPDNAPDPSGENEDNDNNNDNGNDTDNGVDNGIGEDYNNDTNSDTNSDNTNNNSDNNGIDSGDDDNQSNIETTTDTVIITVNSGDDSFRVSRRLEEAGLVESATAYNNYLMDNGYSRSIRVGRHEVPLDADYAVIARILTGRG
ncbi:MAG: hypothetical protein LBC96_06415 [Lachnospiraceae bacterium]|jgi:hypothetical protein|nr:hypothetical protein [Lachnospiraceae bacterium]